VFVVNLNLKKMEVPELKPYDFEMIEKLGKGSSCVINFC